METEQAFENTETTLNNLAGAAGVFLGTDSVESFYENAANKAEIEFKKRQHRIPADKQEAFREELIRKALFNQARVKVQDLTRPSLRQASYWRDMAIQGAVTVGVGMLAVATAGAITRRMSGSETTETTTEGASPFAEEVPGFKASERPHRHSKVAAVN